MQDIAAMKLNAIVGNGTRPKNFVDIAFLSSHMPLSLMLDAYTKKYSTRNPVMVLKALDYHKDIDFNEPIRIIKGKYSWKIIKERLSQMLDHPYTLLEELKMEG